MVCEDVHDIPVIAIVDPDMMSSMPKGLTAATGMDALTHAIEGYITKDAWEMTDPAGNIKEGTSERVYDHRGFLVKKSQGTCP